MPEVDAACSDVNGGRSGEELGGKGRLLGTIFLESRTNGTELLLRRAKHYHVNRLTRLKFNSGAYNSSQVEMPCPIDVVLLIHTQEI